MAEMNLPQKGGKRKVAAPRIDLTPMVDLGFLLITFFMFTTSLAQSRKMEINMPAPGPVEHPTAFPEESTITLLPAANHRVFYYEGILKTDGQMKSSPVASLRPVLQQKQTQAASLPGSFSTQAHQLHVLIKPNSDSKYADLVNLMDEMLILKIDYYAIVDITPGEASLIKGIPQ